MQRMYGLAPFGYLINGSTKIQGEEVSVSNREQFTTSRFKRFKCIFPKRKEEEK
jgi:hypothetical protein